MPSHLVKINQAIRDALSQEMKRDPTIVVMGEDIRSGGIFNCTRGLLDDFGPQRVLDTPLSEAGYIGVSIGAAMTGLRPVAELQFFDFFGVGMDQLSNQLAKLRFMSGGTISLPVVVRAPFGAARSYGAQHSQCLYSVFVHIPGFKVVAPATPYDAKGLLTTALRQDDPVIFFEHKSLYGLKGEVPEGSYTIPFGKAEIKQTGNDVTVVGISRTVHIALEAASTLERNNGIKAEVIDLRSLYPLDEETVITSVRKTGKLVVVDEDSPRCSLASEIAALVATKAIDSVKAPVKIVSPPHVPVPFSPTLEEEYLPSTRKIIEAVKSLI